MSQRTPSPSGRAARRGVRGRAVLTVVATAVALAVPAAGVAGPVEAAQAEVAPRTATSRAATLPATARNATSLPARDRSPRKRGTVVRPRTTTAATATATASGVTTDRSTQLPRTSHDEVVGDFLGRGHDQRMVIDDGALTIYDPRGGAPSSVPTDLQTEGGDFEYGKWFGPWKDPLRGKVGVVSIAWTPQALYLAGRTPAGEHLLYKLPPDGSCATRGCATWVRNLPGHDIFKPGCCEVEFALTTTSLAVGPIAGWGQTIAVGLAATRPVFRSWDSYWSNTPDPGGVLFYDPETGSSIGSYAGLPSAGDKTMVTALDWDDTGSGLLAIGVSDGQMLHAVRVSHVGGLLTVQALSPTRWAAPNPTSFPYPVTTSVRIGHRPDGSPVVAAGVSDGSVKLWDPAVTSSSLLSQVAGGGSDAVDALTFVERMDGTAGLADLVAVSSPGNSARVLRHNGATTMVTLPVAPGGATTTDVGGIRSWFPGYATGVLGFRNATTDEQLQLDFATRPNAGYGCWFAQGFNGRPPLPTTSVVLDPASTPTWSVAARTAGTNGDCASDDVIGQWAAYVVVTPVGRPADRTAAKLVVSRENGLSIQSVGGSLTLSAVRDTSDTKRPLGSWTVTVGSPPAPTPPSSIKVTGKRLDGADVDRPVYRVDVGATTWGLPVSTPLRNQTVLPPMKVVGTASDGTSVPLGLLVPQGQPTRSTSGSITLSPVSFYWQNPDVGQQITDITVVAGTVSSKVGLAGLPLPVDGALATGLIVCSASGSTSCSDEAAPWANGLDQAPLRIQVMQDDTVLPLTDPAYGRVYYRDENGDLLTGLVPADGSAYVRVSPYAGAYPNDGSAGSPVRPPTNAPVGGRFGYLTTTTTVEREVTAHLGGSLEASDVVKVDGIVGNPVIQPGGEAGQGFYLTGCTGDYAGSAYCRVGDGSVPGLFLTTDPVTSELRIGLQLRLQAQTSLTSLPLQQVAGQVEHTVNAGPLLVNNGEVHLSGTARFQPADTVDAWLVTHGSQVPVRALRVGGGN